MSFRRKLKNKSAQKAEKLKTDLISQLYEIYITTKRPIFIILLPRFGYKNIKPIGNKISFWCI